MSEEHRSLVLSHMLCGADARNVDHCDGCREAVSDLDALIAAVRAEQDDALALVRREVESAHRRVDAQDSEIARLRARADANQELFERRSEQLQEETERADAAEAEIARLQQENARLGEALANYGQHYESCPRWKHLVRAVCDCGFSAALRGEEGT